MRTLVATADVAGAAAPTVRPEHMGRIEAAAAEVFSANTRRAYATAWRAWSAWCASEGVEPVPAQPVLVAAHLAERREAGAGISTLRTAVAAIADEHGSRGAPSPTVHPGVRRVLRGIARRQASAGRTPRQEAALTAEALAAIRATAHRPRTRPGGRTASAEHARRRGDMEVAIITVMRNAPLRRGRTRVGGRGAPPGRHGPAGGAPPRRSRGAGAHPPGVGWRGEIGVRRATPPRIGMARYLAVSGASATALILAVRRLLSACLLCMHAATSRAGVPLRGTTEPDDDRPGVVSDFPWELEAWARSVPDRRGPDRTRCGPVQELRSGRNNRRERSGGQASRVDGAGGASTKRGVVA